MLKLVCQKIELQRAKNIGHLILLIGYEVTIKGAYVKI